MLKRIGFWMMPFLAVIFLVIGSSIAVAQPRPDYTIDSITYSPINPDSEDIITITAVVRNAGDTATLDSVLEIDLDNEVNPTTYTVPALVKHTNFTQIRLVGPLSQGTHSVTATADVTNVIDEKKENNNSLTINIDVAPSPPDLIVESLTHWPPTPVIGDPVTITAVVKNIGEGPATTSTLELIVEGEAVPITFNIPMLLPDESAQVETLVIKAAPGTYQVTATADFDDDNEESNEDNNVSLYEFSVRGPGPDLIISSLVYEPALALADQTITITAEVENAGNAGATTSTLWILVGSEIIPETFVIEPLDPAETLQAQIQLIVTEPGSVPVTATADAEDDVAESDETNNDEIIDIDVYNSDVIKLRQYLLGNITLTEEEKPFYDINQDGIIDIADIISLIAQ